LAEKRPAALTEKMKDIDFAVLSAPTEGGAVAAHPLKQFEVSFTPAGHNEISARAGSSAAHLEAA
jgi:hypothetical protein